MGVGQRVLLCLPDSLASSFVEAAQREQARGAAGTRRESSCGRHRVGALGQEKGIRSEGLWAAQVAQKKAKIILTLIFFVFEINFLPFLLPLSSFFLHYALI